MGRNHSKRDFQKNFHLLLTIGVTLPTNFATCKVQSALFLSGDRSKAVAVYSPEGYRAVFTALPRSQVFCDAHAAAGSQVRHIHIISGKITQQHRLRRNLSHAWTSWVPFIFYPRSCCKACLQTDEFFHSPELSIISKIQNINKSSLKK